MSKDDTFVLSLVGTFVAGLAAHWFIGGDYAEHSFIRNIFVVVQLLIGLWIIFYALRKRQPRE